MKCEGCGDTTMFFSIIPKISSDIGWSSHPLIEKDGEIRLYHYQCGDVDVMDFYKMILDLVGGRRATNPLKRFKNTIF